MNAQERAQPHPALIPGEPCPTCGQEVRIGLGIADLNLVLQKCSQSQLATRLGVDASTISQWRRRQRVPSHFRQAIKQFATEATLPA